MQSDAPLIVLLAAGPAHPGAEALALRAVEHAESGHAVRVLLSHEGLAWASDERLAVRGVTVGVCSRQAHDAGWTLEDAPAGVQWSALASWVREAGDAAAVWCALP